MSQILSEKGAAIIKAVEAGARTGIMGTMWDGRQVQTLIEKTAHLPDILYITVANDQGLVLASSNRGVIGARMSAGSPEGGLNPSEAINWLFKNIGPQRHVLKCTAISGRSPTGTSVCAIARAE